MEEHETSQAGATGQEAAPPPPGQPTPPPGQPTPPPYSYPPPYTSPPYPPGYYPPPAYQPVFQKTSDTPVIALIIGAVGLLYWFPPFVLPGVSLYLAGKARKEIAAGMPVAPNAESYLTIARVLAIVGMVIGGLWILLFLVFIVAAIISH
jgi:hypothetical protein